jgi:hypothetical protein
MILFVLAITDLGPLLRYTVGLSSATYPYFISYPFQIEKIEVLLLSGSVSVCVILIQDKVLYSAKLKISRHCP